jgi:DNA polymerase
MWPTDIATLREMVVGGAPLPGCAYGPVRFPSVGPVSCDVMVISDLPDILPSPETTASLNAALLQRMLAAIGIDIAQCHCTWLATSMPSTAEVPENDLPDLAAFMLHQIRLIRPKSLVILGSAACKALLGEELMHARAELRNVNHDGRNITTLATFHPRTLIARPTMKKQAWRDLQMFAKRALQ